MKRNMWLVLVTSLLLSVTPLRVGAEEVTSSQTSSNELEEVVETTEIQESSQETEEPIQEISETTTSKESTIDDVKDTTNTEAESFIEESIEQYVSLAKEEVIIFKSTDFDEPIDHHFAKGQTFFAKEKFVLTESKDIYYSLYDFQDQLIGYVNEESITLVDNPGGEKQAISEYLTVTSSEGSLLSDFNGEEKGKVSGIANQTFLATEKYLHFDGTVYYSIYNNSQKWQGYINEKNISLAGQNKQGVYQAVDKFAIIKSNNYSIWQNFAWTKKYDSRQFVNRTFKVNGEYHHYNGDIYYSLYDTNGIWYGYINKNATSITNEAQGEYVSLGKYVSVKNGSGSTWNNFQWHQRHTQSSLAGETLLAKGIYYHANGSDYYSLYDRNNKWYGYINKNLVTIANGKQGSYQNFDKYVTVTSNNYDMWQNFEWKKLSTTKNMNNKTYHAKGKYNHFNGSVYYSLYDNKGKWYGYLNSNGSSVGDGAQGIYQHYGKEVTIAKKNYPIWQNFSWVEKDNTTRHFNKKFKARGKYEHFNGSTYYSIYDNQGKWYGYLNATATAQDAEKMAKVQQLLNRKYASPNFGIYVMSLGDGSTASMNGNKTFTAASTGKLPAMYYTQKMINEKKIDPNRQYLYTDAINQMEMYSYMRGGAGILQGKPFGTYYSLDTMLNWTAKYSDNQGANFLGYYGANQYEWKMRNEISRIIGRQWVSPFQVTAKENALLIAEMDKQGGQVMKYMQNTVFDNQRIPKYLPVKVAHKIGDVGSYTHDVAVVYTDRPYVLSVMTQNGQSYESISILSKEIYDIMK